LVFLHARANDFDRLYELRVRHELLLFPSSRPRFVGLTFYRPKAKFAGINNIHFGPCFKNYVEQ
jgi:hypothetical protein